MFIIINTYKQPIEIIEQHLASHRQFLADCYAKNLFVVAGPKCPRDGGIIISQLKNKNDLLAVLNKDPFIKHDLVDYEIIEFLPVTAHANFHEFI